MLNKINSRTSLTESPNETRAPLNNEGVKYMRMDDIEQLANFSYYLHTSPESVKKTYGLSNTKLENKIAVFIKDVPEFGRKGILSTLEERLMNKGIFPLHSYSVSEILRDSRNIQKMKTLSVKRPSRYQESTELNTNQQNDQFDSRMMVEACNLIFNQIFEHQLFASPQLMIFDYMSESFVNAEKLIKKATQFHYRILILKRTDKQSTDEIVKRAVKKINRYINLNFFMREELAVIQQMEKDKFKADGIFIQNRDIKELLVKFGPIYPYN